MLGATTTFAVTTMENMEALASWDKNQNAFLYIPEIEDSIITGNEIINKKLMINDELVIDFALGNSSITIRIEANGEESNGLTLYDVLRN